MRAPGYGCPARFFLQACRSRLGGGNERDPGCATLRCSLRRVYGRSGNSSTPRSKGAARPRCAPLRGGFGAKPRPLWALLAPPGRVCLERRGPRRGGDPRLASRVPVATSARPLDGGSDGGSHRAPPARPRRARRIVERGEDRRRAGHAANRLRTERPHPPRRRRLVGHPAARLGRLEARHDGRAAHPPIARGPPPAARRCPARTGVRRRRRRRDRQADRGVGVLAPTHVVQPQPRPERRAVHRRQAADFRRGGRHAAAGGGDHAAVRDRPAPHRGCAPTGSPTRTS